MKTIKTEQPTMAMEVRRAIESAPSRDAYKAAVAKINELADKQAKTKAEIVDLYGDKAAGKDHPGSLAQVLLKGGDVPDSSGINEAINAAQRRLRVIDEALSIQSREVLAARARYSSEVNISLRRIRSGIVERTASALKEIRQAYECDAAILPLLSAAGINAQEIDNVSFFPVCGDSASDLAWLSGRRAEGFAV
jgi:hypothetical protein